MLIQYCDACGKPIDREFIRPKLRFDILNMSGANLIHHEYCEPCYQTFTQFLKRFIKSGWEL